jgi:phosphoenolpyruvate synthase/pyruvate phosphate dikinase
MEHLRAEGPGYFEYVQLQMRKEAAEFKEYAWALIPITPKLETEELITTFGAFMHRYIFTYALGAITFPYESIMSERLSASLVARYENATDIMAEITKSSYTNFVVQSEKSLEKIKQAIDAEKDRLVDEYLRDFFYIDSSYSKGPVLSKDEVIRRSQDAHPLPPPPVHSAGSYELTRDEELLAKLLIATEEIRDQRKMFNLIGSYTLFRFLEEAVRRTGVDPTLARRIWWFEYKDIFHDPEELTTRLRARTEATMLLLEGSIHYLDYMAIEPRSTPGSTDEIKGMVASKGKVRGKVRVVLGPSQFGAFRPGEILVTESTRPDFVGIMKKAAAIVADEGGIMSHAAIVSRELGVPCIIGTKIAVQVLKDGDEIEVDAEKGIVRILNKK